MRFSTLILLFPLLLASPVPAFAQAAPDPEALKQRSQEALELAQDGKTDQAIVIGEEVIAVASGELALNIHFNLAAAYEHSGNTAYLRCQQVGRLGLRAAGELHDGVRWGRRRGRRETGPRGDL